MTPLKVRIKAGNGTASAIASGAVLAITLTAMIAVARFDWQALFHPVIAAVWIAFAAGAVFGIVRGVKQHRRPPVALCIDDTGVTMGTGATMLWADIAAIIHRQDMMGALHGDRLVFKNRPRTTWPRSIALSFLDMERDAFIAAVRDAARAQGYTLTQTERFYLIGHSRRWTLS